MLTEAVATTTTATTTETVYQATVLFTGIQSKNINKNMSFHMCAVGLHRIISTGSPLGTSGCSTQLILEGHVASYLQDRTYLQASRQASLVGGTSLAGTSLGPWRD